MKSPPALETISRDAMPWFLALEKLDWLLRENTMMVDLFKLDQDLDALYQLPVSLRVRICQDLLNYCHARSGVIQSEPGLVILAGRDVQEWLAWQREMAQ